MAFFQRRDYLNLSQKEVYRSHGAINFVMDMCKLISDQGDLKNLQEQLR